MKKYLVSAIAMVLSLSVVAQEQQELRIKEPGRTEFQKHWFMQAQGGAAYTLGEAAFGDLISPAAALNVGYSFSPVFRMRLGASGWEARGSWVTPRQNYKFNFIQGNLDAVLDLSNLFCGFNPKRTLDVYAFLGAGYNYGFDNDEAVAIADAGYDLRYLWRDSKSLVAGRGGLGMDIRLSDAVSLNVEANANVLSDHFNSKKAGNADWHFNGLVGLTIKFGKSYKEIPPVYYEPEPVPEPEPEPAPVVEEPKPAPAPVVEEVKVEPLVRDIFFTINSSKIRESEQVKVDELVAYMNQYPESKVMITGYADKATGNASINERISKRRAQSVADAIAAAGIALDRITTDAKGDTEQPFEVMESNRVSICIAE